MAVPQNALSMTGAALIAAANQTRNANSVLRLFKGGFNPSPTTTKAEFLANEADYDGYAALTIVAWGAPILFGLGWATFAPTQTFRWGPAGAGTNNMIGGTFLLTQAGDLLTYEVFEQERPMQGPGQAVVTTPIQITPAG